MFELWVRIAWGDHVLCERRLEPARDFWLGEDADFALPESVLGASRLRLVRMAAGRVWIGDEALAPGQHARRTFGDFEVEIWLAPAERVRFGAGGDRRIAPFFAGSLALAAGALVYAAFVAPPLDDEEMQREQIELMQVYLAASAEREVEVEEPKIDTSRSARGETNGRGAHFAVQGPTADPHIARQAALRDASEFGMIGLLSTGAGGDPEAPVAGGHPIDEPMQNGDPFGDALDPQGGEEYADHGINPPIDAAKDPLSTFAIDVDTGSYTVAKRKLDDGTLPPLSSVRAEEFVNSFDYEYPGPEQGGTEDAFSVHLDAAPSPFDAGHHLLRVAIQGRRIPPADRPPVHLVYLVDTSGSMASTDKLGLAQTSLRLLTNVLRPGDTVALCTYAGSVREVLAPTGIENKGMILRAIDELDAQGSTAMSSGLQIAYRLAARRHVRGRISRVIVLSDGDANVGTTGPDEILKEIRAQRELGITLSTVGFGTGNYKDAVMERLADAGDGNYSYIGNERDAQRVFVDQAGGLLQVIARDVKLQLEFDPSVVRRYRLIGYENRDVADRDFRDDRIDGGEIGAGHAVTAIYDLELVHERRSPVTLRLRHKPALEGDRATEIAIAMAPERIRKSFSDVDTDFKFATAVAGFAELLRGSPYAAGWSFDRVAALAKSSHAERPERTELVELVESASELHQSLALASP